MKRIKSISMTIFLGSMLFMACSKENSEEEVVEETFLSFKTTTKGNSAVLYSKWIPSQFPNSSQNNSEFFDLPQIENSLFNPKKDAILVYGRRNNTFLLPTTMPQDAESYVVELITGINGTTTRIRVTSLLLDPLQDIFFNPNFNAAFRVVIVPGEKLLPLNSKKTSTFQNASYETLAKDFGLGG